MKLLPGIVLLLVCTVAAAGEVEQRIAAARALEADAAEAGSVALIEAWRAVVALEPKNEAARQALAETAWALAARIEAAEAIEQTHAALEYEARIVERLPDTLWRTKHDADAGDGRAQLALGVFLRHGLLAEADERKACDAYSRAAQSGVAAGQYRAALCVSADDPARALELTRRAAAGGHAAAQHLLAERLLAEQPPRTDEAFQWAERSAAQGRVSVLSLLGWMFAGGHGVKKDVARAASLYRDAAKAGSASARNNLGELYETGEGVAKDPGTAVAWYTRAAEQGYAPAQYNLARMLAGGAGVKRDDCAARMWLGRAKGQGFDIAGTMLEWMDREKRCLPE
jgi:TPR repeat protein